MQRKDFGKVFSVLEKVGSQQVRLLEQTFHDTNGEFLWDLGIRQRRSTDTFSREIVQWDFGLKVGDVRGVETSLGNRMIVIHTRAGNVCLQEKVQESGTFQPLPDEEQRPVVVIPHYPEVLKNILGVRSVRMDQLYLFTGFFNPKDNLAVTLDNLAEKLAVA